MPRALEYKYSRDTFVFLQFFPRSISSCFLSAHFKSALEQKRLHPFWIWAVSSFSCHFPTLRHRNRVVVVWFEVISFCCDLLLTDIMKCGFVTLLLICSADSAVLNPRPVCDASFYANLLLVNLDHSEMFCFSCSLAGSHSCCNDGITIFSLICPQSYSLM